MVTPPQRLADLQPAQRRILAQILRTQGVEITYAGLVLEYASRSDQSWRSCCNSACESCVLALGRAVDAWRAQRARHGH